MGRGWAAGRGLRRTGSPIGHSRRGSSVMHRRPPASAWRAPAAAGRRVADWPPDPAERVFAVPRCRLVSRDLAGLLGKHSGPNREALRTALAGRGRNSSNPCSDAKIANSYQLLTESSGLARGSRSSVSCRVSEPTSSKKSVSLSICSSKSLRSIGYQLPRATRR